MWHGTKWHGALLALAACAGLAMAADSASAAPYALRSYPDSHSSYERARRKDYDLYRRPRRQYGTYSYGSRSGPFYPRRSYWDRRY